MSMFSEAKRDDVCLLIQTFDILPFITVQWVRTDHTKYTCVAIGWLFWKKDFEF